MQTPYKSWASGASVWCSDRGGKKVWVAKLSAGISPLARFIIDRMKRKSKIFDANYSPYGTYTGEKGNPDQWRESFNQRFSKQEIKDILKDSNPYVILGILPGATLNEVKKAFRIKARETHPDHNPGLNGDDFKKVNAAYQEIVESF